MARCRVLCAINGVVEERDDCGGSILLDEAGIVLLREIEGVQGERRFVSTESSSTPYGESSETSAQSDVRVT
jgi:hypothetical protein